MGLDMYLTGKKFRFTDWNNPANNLKEDGFEVLEHVLRLGYWRKHPNLHGYIVNTFAEGVDECQEITLSAENIETVIQAVKEGKLPETSGFFFGNTDGTETEEDLRILTAALAWLQTKDERISKSIIYRASW